MCVRVSYNIFYDVCARTHIQETPPVFDDEDDIFVSLPLIPSAHSSPPLIALIYLQLLNFGNFVASVDTFALNYTEPFPQN